MINNSQNEKNNVFKLHKQKALKDIQVSIETWTNFQKKIFSSSFFQNKRNLNIGRLQT